MNINEHFQLNFISLGKWTTKVYYNVKFHRDVLKGSTNLKYF